MKQDKVAWTVESLERIEKELAGLRKDAVMLGDAERSPFVLLGEAQEKIRPASDVLSEVARQQV